MASVIKSIFQPRFEESFMTSSVPGVVTFFHCQTAYRSDLSHATVSVLPDRLGTTGDQGAGNPCVDATLLQEADDEPMYQMSITALLPNLTAAVAATDRRHHGVSDDQPSSAFLTAIGVYTKRSRQCHVRYTIHALPSQRATKPTAQEIGNAPKLGTGEWRFTFERDTHTRTQLPRRSMPLGSSFYRIVAHDTTTADHAVVGGHSAAYPTLDDAATMCTAYIPLCVHTSFTELERVCG